MPVYDELPDISTVKNMCKKRGMYELILSAFNLLWVAMTSEVADSSLYRLAALLLEKHCPRYQILNLSTSIQNSVQSSP